MTHTQCDVLIIGSGPAGVSAAYPLVEAGLKVLMIDAQDDSESYAYPPSGDFLNIKETNANQHQWLLNIDDVNSKIRSSPKLRVPAFYRSHKRYNEYQNIECDNFIAVGSLNSGGLSNMWGAGVAIYDDEDLHDWPISHSDLSYSYKTVIQRIGVSGCNQSILPEYSDLLQKPLTLDANHELIFKRYQHRKYKHFSLWQSHNAVLSETLNQRQACDYTGMCLWGCNRHSVWSARMELPSLGRHANFTHTRGLLVEKLQRDGALWKCLAKKLANQAPISISAKRVLLAAGAINTTKILLSTLNHFDKPIRLKSNPSAAFMVFIPQRLGAKFTNAFGMSQLNFSIKYHDALGYGNLFSANFLPLTEYISASGLPHRLGKHIFSLLIPSCIIGNCFIDGDYTNHNMTLRRNETLFISGENIDEVDVNFSKINKILSKSFRRIGAFLLYNSFRTALPGSDIHYAGTVPMSNKPEMLQTNKYGELHGNQGLFVVDAANFTTLPSKPLTLTIMANADRVARYVSKNF